MKEIKLNTILQGNCLEVLKEIPDNSVNCCVTSPPYYGLRDYGTGKWVGGDPNCPHRRVSKRSDKTITGHSQEEIEGNVGDAIYKSVCPLCGAVREDEQIGLEETPEEYIDRLVSVFREVKRILTDDGTLWVNIGDSYAGGQGRWGGDITNDSMQTQNKGSLTQIEKTKKWTHSVIKPKDLIGIPWMLAFALRADGWYLRQDIIWHKPNPMPESVKDRCTKSHEYIFMLSKNARYYFDSDAIQEDADPKNEARYKCAFNTGKEQENFRPNGASNTMGMKEYTGMRNKRDVWTIPPSSFKGAHFATFPEDLVKPCIISSTKVGGVVLDPFFGSGTTGAVAVSLNRNYIGVELNPEYIEIANNRLGNTQLSFFGLI